MLMKSKWRSEGQSSLMLKKYTRYQAERRKETLCMIPQTYEDVTDIFQEKRYRSYKKLFMRRPPQRNLLKEVIMELNNEVLNVVLTHISSILIYTDDWKFPSLSSNFASP